MVVDGPGLVYLVYNRLLSWSEGRSNVVDAQPSANEVSIGVMQFLLSLRGLDVRMHVYCSHFLLIGSIFVFVLPCLIIHMVN